VGPRAGLDTEARGKVLSPLPGTERRSPGRPEWLHIYRSKVQETDWLELPVPGLQPKVVFFRRTWRVLINCNVACEHSR
jgi:hypothetical protein